MAKEVKNADSLFVKALNYQIPKDKIEVITDKSGGRPLSYVSWAYAWGMFKQIYPDAKYRIIKNDQGLPYFSDPQTGIMCYTEITANGETHEMWLLVMNAANKAMKLTTYEYNAWDYKKNQWVTKRVEAANMFDINKTIMRCLVKNMAMFGFGLNIYNGDDLPEFDLEPDTQSQVPVQQPKTRRTSQTVPDKAAPVQQNNQPLFGSTLDILKDDPYANIKQILANLQSIDEMMVIYQEHKNEVESNPDIKMLFGIRKGQINKQTA